MAASTNKRIYYAVQTVGIKPDGDTSWAAADIIKGLQSVGMTTTFNLTQVFELGQLSIYENIEGIPNIECSLNKVLDGRPLIWHMATQGTTTTSPSLSGRSNTNCIVGLSIYTDTADEASAATPDSMCEMSGMFPSSLAYNFPLEDSFNEEVTLVGNNKVWAGDSRIDAAAVGIWTGAQDLDAVAGFTAGSIDTLRS